MKYKIIKCTSYRSNNEIKSEWYEVQYLSNVRTWWFFGKRVWKTLKFDDEMKAREFINKCQNNDYTVKQEVWFCD